MISEQHSASGSVQLAKITQVIDHFELGEGRTEFRLGKT